MDVAGVLAVVLATVEFALADPNPEATTVCTATTNAPVRHAKMQ